MKLRLPWARKKKSKAVVDLASDSSAEPSLAGEADDGGDQLPGARAALSRLVKRACAQIIPQLRKNKRRGKNYAFNAVMRLEGDELAQERLVVVTLDTQCHPFDLISERFANILLRGRDMEPVDDITMRTVGSENIKILGVIRGVVWRWKGRSKTYTSKFYVADIGKFDALVGGETIRRYELVRLCSDIQRSLDE